MLRTGDRAIIVNLLVRFWPLVLALFVAPLSSAWAEPIDFRALRCQLHLSPEHEELVRERLGWRRGILRSEIQQAFRQAEISETEANQLLTQSANLSDREVDRLFRSSPRLREFARAELTPVRIEAWRARLRQFIVDHAEGRGPHALATLQLLGTMSPAQMRDFLWEVLEVDPDRDLILERRSDRDE